MSVLYERFQGCAHILQYELGPSDGGPVEVCLCRAAHPACTRVVMTGACDTFWHCIVARAEVIAQIWGWAKNICCPDLGNNSSGLEMPASMCTDGIPVAAQTCCDIQ